MDVTKTALPGVIIIQPKVYGDARGYFMETYSSDRYKEAGITETFVQDNLSQSQQGILRGLHFQKPMEQGKLVQVLVGEVFDVAVDIRYGSATFGQWEAVVLNAENKKQFYVPPGFAHGFVVTSREALFMYKCTDLYNPAGECSIAWNDPDLDIPWPVDSPLLSEKDKNGRLLKDLNKSELPAYD
jgi:dTDP-4-dehydrorhamnose 3,5-epimerase